MLRVRSSVGLRTRPEHTYQKILVAELFSVVMTTIVSFVRVMPLFLSSRPRTPLRVLCLMAVDTHHVLRTSQRVPWPRMKVLAALLDFAACANAEFDGKRCNAHVKQTTYRILSEAGLDSLLHEYLRRLRLIERQRPGTGGERANFQQVRSYRESVIRLSLGTVAAITGDKESLDSGIRATYSDVGLEILFRIVMQCQVIDDVFDYSSDAFAGLPSFLTASASLSESIHHTRSISHVYADMSELPTSADTLAFRLALFFVSLIASHTISTRAILKWRSTRYVWSRLT